MREGWEGGMGGDGSEREGRGGMRGRVGWKDGREGGKERGRERERRGGRRQGRRGGRKGGRRISGWVVVISSTFIAAPLMLVSSPDPPSTLQEGLGTRQDTAYHIWKICCHNIKLEV